MEPMALGSPAGSPAPSPNSPSNYLPNFLLGDNNMSRVGAMSPESRFSSQGLQSPSSPLTSYSQDCRYNRQKALFGSGNATTLPQVTTETHINGPPTRTLYESLDTRQSTESRCTPMHSQSMPHNQSRLLTPNLNCSVNSPYMDLPLNSTNNDSSQGLLQWVTVFGFPNSALNTVLAHMSSRVRIVDKHLAPHPQSNWIHLKCSTEQEAQRALACNGSIVSGSIMIGIVPCTDEGVILGCDKENRSKLNESLRHLSTPIKGGTPCTPGINKTPIRNARPLVPGYNQHLNSQAVRTPENIPHKTSGIVTKAMEYVFGW